MRDGAWDFFRHEAFFTILEQLKLNSPYLFTDWANTIPLFTSTSGTVIVIYLLRLTVIKQPFNTCIST